MRVAILSQNARAGDAIGSHVAETTAYFLDRGAGVSVVLGDDRQCHPAVRPWVIQQRDWPAGHGWKTLVAADVIVVQFPQYYALLDLLPLLADGKRRIIFDYHGVTPPVGQLANHRDNCLRGLEYRSLASIADAVITHSTFAAGELYAQAVVEAERRHHCCYVVDDQSFSPGTAHHPLRQRLQLNDVRIALFVGRLASNKRVPDLIRAIGVLRDESPAVHAVIVGPSGDCYESERLLCREVAADVGVTDRVHFLGSVDAATLIDCYRSADLLVMPSIHEGFCLPVIEAMACGLPVVASRAAALPETLGSAGLTFESEDVSDLARTIKKALRDKRSTESINRIAVVTPTFGKCCGGAERSLSFIATQLHDRGFEVEVFAIANVDSETPFPIRVFPADVIDPFRRTAAIENAHENPDAASSYFANTLKSKPLVEELERSKPDAVIAGPFGTALTRDVVRQFGDRAILVPCLHRETIAGTATVREIFRDSGGVLYHSAAEQALAQTEYGFNHPNSIVIGTHIDVDQRTESARGRALARTDRYVLICGRKISEKGMPLIVAWARQYSCDFPGRFRFVFVGEGEFPVPEEPWALDLGRVSETDKLDLMAGAAALIQLSANESLSLVVLEAMACGTPVVVNGHSPALAAHVRASGGGWTVHNSLEFGRTLNRLFDKPDSARERGQAGSSYVAKEFGRPTNMVDSIIGTIANLNRSTSDIMRQGGAVRAKQFSQKHWRQSMDAVLEAALESTSPILHAMIDMESPESELQDASTWRLQIHNRQGLPLVPTGPGRTEILVRVRGIDGEMIHDNSTSALIRMIAVGQSVTVTARLPKLPPGSYGLEAGLITHRGLEPAATEWYGTLATLDVTELARRRSTFHHEIDAARAVERLPDEYVDVTTGRFANLKRKIKQKLLQNFRTGYVDVLARQQSKFNRHVTEVISDLSNQASARDIQSEVIATKSMCEELRDRVRQLERRHERHHVGGER